MSRGKKLLVVGCVLALGIGLAWPFRKTGLEHRHASATMTSPAQPPAKSPTLPPAATTAPLIESPAPAVAATMTSLGQGEKEQPRAIGSGTAPTASFDLANHPALAGSTAPRTASSPVTPPVPPPAESQRKPNAAHSPESYPRPAYETVERDAPHPRDATPEKQIRHVVQNSDTLEKLAKRYLGDEGRALEIFDLNRDVLDNPHLLPIEAELRIPVTASRLGN